jgi:SAM-dependent methyltransferase
MALDIRAAAYDILSNPEARLRREGPFLAERVEPGAEVLDLACGTGAHARFLAEAGARVTACDLSPAMIAVAATRRAHDRLAYAVRDMRQPPPGAYDLVLCIGNALNQLPSRDDVGLAIGRAREALAPGGRILLHLLNPEHPAQREPRYTTRSGIVDGQEVRVVKSLLPAGDRHLLSITYHIRAAPDTEAGEVEAPPWEIRHDGGVLLDIPAGELLHLLEDAGYGGTTLFGGLDGSPFDAETSPDLVAEAYGDDE